MSDPASGPIHTRSENPYAEDPEVLGVYPIRGVVGVEENAVLCHQGADLRRYCFENGDAGTNRAWPLFAIVMPRRLNHARWIVTTRVLLASVTILVAGFVGLKIASLIFFVVTMSSLFLLLLPKFRATIGTTPRGIWRIRFRRAGMLVATLPLAIWTALLAVSFVTKGAPPPQNTFLQPTTLIFCALAICHAVGDITADRLTVFKVAKDVYRIEGLSPQLVARLRADLAQRAEP